jgi:hypothetical protein
VSQEEADAFFAAATAKVDKMAAAKAAKKKPVIELTDAEDDELFATSDAMADELKKSIIAKRKAKYGDEPVAKKPKIIYLLIKAIYENVQLEIYTYRYKTLKEATDVIREKFKSYDEEEIEDIMEDSGSVSMSDDAMCFGTISPSKYTAEEWKIIELGFDNP